MTQPSRTKCSVKTVLFHWKKYCNFISWSVDLETDKCTINNITGFFKTESLKQRLCSSAHTVVTYSANIVGITKFTLHRNMEEINRKLSFHSENASPILLPLDILHNIFLISFNYFFQLCSVWIWNLYYFFIHTFSQ